MAGGPALSSLLRLVWCKGKERFCGLNEPRQNARALSRTRQVNQLPELALRPRARLASRHCQSTHTVSQDILVLGQPWTCRTRARQRCCWG